MNTIATLREIIDGSITAQTFPVICRALHNAPLIEDRDLAISYAHQHLSSREEEVERVWRSAVYKAIEDKAVETSLADTGETGIAVALQLDGIKAAAFDDWLLQPGIGVFREKIAWLRRPLYERHRVRRLLATIPPAAARNDFRQWLSENGGPLELLKPLKPFLQVLQTPRDLTTPSILLELRNTSRT